jgi:hypothetical protein
VAIGQRDRTREDSSASAPRFESQSPVEKSRWTGEKTEALSETPIVARMARTLSQLQAAMDPDRVSSVQSAAKIASIGALPMSTIDYTGIDEFYKFRDAAGDLQYAMLVSHLV